MQFCFADMVVVKHDLIGVVVKSWNGTSGPNHDVYVRSLNDIHNYKEVDMERYMVRHKELDQEELMYQRNSVNGT